MERRFRLTSSSDIQRVRRFGRSYAHPLIVLVVLSNEASSVRVAVSAGRSVGGAVLRNRAKRLMRAALRPFLRQLTPGWDVVLIARSPILEASYGEISQALGILIRRAGILQATDDQKI